MAGGENTMDCHRASNQNDDPLLIETISVDDIIEKTEHLNMTSKGDSLDKDCQKLFDSFNKSQQKLLQKGLIVIDLLCDKFGVESKENVKMKNIFFKFPIRAPFQMAVAVFVVQNSILQIKESKEVEVGIEEVCQFLNVSKVHHCFTSTKMIFNAIQKVKEMSDEIEIYLLDLEGLYLVDDEEPLQGEDDGTTELGQGHNQTKEWTAAEIEALMTKEICEEDFPDLKLYVIEDEDLASFKLEKQKEEAARIKRERDGYLSPTSK